MKRQGLRLTLVIVAFFLSVGLIPAQDSFESQRINSNLGASLVVPVKGTSRLVKRSPGATAGAGYNFTPHHALIGEFMWNGLNPPNRALDPIRTASQNSSLSGKSNLFALTANYRFQLQGKLFGVYGIGGGGWYYRTSGLNAHIRSGPNVSCTPPWLWWGFSCASGVVLPNQTVGHFNSSALGANAGAGLTIKVADPSYRLYFEPRFHYAPTKNFTTRIVDLTFGIRY